MDDTFLQLANRIGRREKARVAMRGVITTRDVLRHPVLIARNMGIGCYLRCLRAIVSGRRATFLGECVRLTSAGA